MLRVAHVAPHDEGLIEEDLFGLRRCDSVAPPVLSFIGGSPVKADVFFEWITPGRHDAQYTMVVYKLASPFLRRNVNREAIRSCHAEVAVLRIRQNVESGFSLSKAPSRAANAEGRPFVGFSLLAGPGRGSVRIC